MHLPFSACTLPKHPSAAHDHHALAVWAQIAAFFEERAGPVAKLTVQRDCRQLVVAGQRLRASKLAAERLVNRLLQACETGAPDRKLVVLKTRLEGAVAQIGQWQGQMEGERARPRPIAAAFVTFKCGPQFRICLRLPSATAG